ncbi:MAG: hypothetical protein L0Y71_04475 [Gemmataceae bacterium]|nr:hypothetical protein [Gemmataceae bacterium]
MMYRLCLGLTLPLLAGQTAPPVGWRTFAPKDAGFSVALPRSPKAKKQQLKLPAGAADVTVFTCDHEVSTGASKPALDVAFVIGVTEYASADMDGVDDKRLRNARDGAVESARGKLIHERKITLAGHPGRELWIQTRDDGMIHTRLYAVKQRLYQTMAVGPKKAVETKEVAAFLDSFRLSK